MENGVIGDETAIAKTVGVCLAGALQSILYMIKAVDDQLSSVAIGGGDTVCTFIWLSVTYLAQQSV